MSVEHRPLEQPATIVTDTDEHAQDAGSNAADSEHPGQSAARTVSLSTRSNSSATHSVPAQIERTQLRVQVAALERELATREQQRQELIAQYERVLEAQQDEFDRERENQNQNETETENTRSKRTLSLSGLLDRWR